MESDPKTKTVIFDPIEMLELERLGEELPSDEVLAVDAVALAYKWRRRAVAEVETAERQRDGSNRDSQNRYQQAHRRAIGLTLYANMIIDAYPMDYLAYLQRLEA